MIDRRSFLKTVLLGGVAFGTGLALGRVGAHHAGPRLLLHGFVPADENLVRETLRAFLGLDDGRLPVPVVDAPDGWRPQLARMLRDAAPRYTHDHRRLLAIRVSPLDHPLPADLLLQMDGRVLDPDRAPARRLVALRERLLGRRAAVAVSCRLEDRPDPLAGGRVLVIETENGLQDRIPLDGRRRLLELRGPAGLTRVETTADGARVAGSCCRHATCRLQGDVSLPGELIACAPNRLVLHVETA